MLSRFSSRPFGTLRIAAQWQKRLIFSFIAGCDNYRNRKHQKKSMCTYGFPHSDSQRQPHVDLHGSSAQRTWIYPLK